VYATVTTAPLRRPLAGLLTVALIVAVLAVLSAVAAGPASAATAGPWPTTWNTYTFGDGSPVRDTNGDENPSSADLTSGTPCAGSPCLGTFPTVQYATDGTNAFFRIRVAADNNDSSKGGYTASAYLVQLYDANNTLEAVVGVNGKTSTSDYVYVVNTGGNETSNSTQYTYPWTGSNAGTRWIPTGDAGGEYFLDFQAPLSAIRTVWPTFTGSTPVKLYYGSSQAANLAVINKDFMVPGDSAALVPTTLSNLAVVKIDAPVVTFDAQGGSAVAPQTLGGAAVTAAQPANPTRSGYRFDGWFTAASGGTQWSFASTVSSSMTLYAHWTQAYTVSFDANGGTGAPASQQVVATGKVSAPSSPTRAGYTLSGWSTVADGSGDAWDFATDTVGADTTLYAQWAPKTNTVTFDSNAAGVSAPPSTSALSGTTMTAPALTRAGYHVTGWTTQTNGGAARAWNFDTDVVTGDVTLYAQWAADTQAITFDGNGHGPVTPSETTAAYGSTLTQPSVTWTGHHVESWNTQPDGDGTPWDFATDTVAGDVTLYAQWVADTVPATVTYDGNGGGAVTPATSSVGFEQAIGTAPTVTWAGHHLTGWNTVQDGSGTAWNFATDPVSGDVTLYAQWAIDTHTITFDGNGHGPVSSATDTVDDGELIASPPTATWAGHHITGWSTAYDGEGTAWDFATDTVTDDVTLYAQWAVDTYAATFDTGGHGAVTPATASPVYGDTLSEPSATWTGHHLTGWSTAPDGSGNAWRFASDTVTGDVTLYAQWAIDTYQVAFDAAGGSSVESQSVAFGGTATQPAWPTRSDYTFDGWYVGDTSYDWAAPVTGPVALTAHWRAIPPGGQNIVFLPPSVLLSGAGAVPLAAVSSSGLPVSLAVTGGSCSLSGANLSAPHDTVCTVVAAQSGSARWLAAGTVTRMIQFVSPADDVAAAGNPTTGPKPVDVPVMANDPSGIEFASAASPQHGTTARQVATVRYTPAKTFRGADTFTYQVSDVLGRTASATVTVDVADAPPTVSGASIAQLQGTTKSVTLVTTDPNGDPVTLKAQGPAAVQTSVTGKTVSISPDNTVSGWVSVRVTADDGAGGVRTSTIRSLVQPRPVARAERRLQDDGTLVSWSASSTAGARYAVFVDGDAVCTTSATQCLIGRVLGPDFTVSVRVLGRDGTTSTMTTAAARGHQQVLLRTVYFDSGEGTLAGAQFQKLVTVGGLIRRLGFHDAHVSGYTDSDGGAQYNLNLSKQRTRMVAKQLLNARQISSVQAWFGYNEPAASNNTDKGKSLNRRVEILVSY